VGVAAAAAAAAAAVTHISTPCLRPVPQQFLPGLFCGIRRKKDLELCNKKIMISGCWRFVSGDH
jgi:hypothetical protein